MDDPRINLLQDRFELRPEGAHSSWKLGRLFFLGGSGRGRPWHGHLVGHDQDVVGRERAFRVAAGFFRSVASFVSSGDRMLKGEESDRITFLLLGSAARGHDGLNFPDTIIFGAPQPPAAAWVSFHPPRPGHPHPGLWLAQDQSRKLFRRIEDPGRGAAYAGQRHRGRA